MAGKKYTSLINESLTPAEAMIEDLLFVHSALEHAGIPHLLVRGEDRRPVLSIDSRLRDAATRALATAAAGEPFYSKTVGSDDSTRVLVSSGALSNDHAAQVLRIFRPRVEPNGGLRYGAAFAVQLEFWTYTPSDILAPVQNAIMRRVLPVSEAVEVPIERHGVTWRTLEGMFDDHVTDITFDIDIVFSWVDGSDPDWQRAVAEHMKSYVVGEGDDSEARFRQVDELRYALRSIHMFAPWVRRIFVVTDSPIPEWLGESSKVTVLRHADYFVDPDVLPVYNSHAIESQLHHIPGISEHFLYSNDDVFFGRPIEPDMFFSPGGISSFVESSLRIGLGTNNPERSGYENAARVNRELLQKRFGKMATRHIAHVPQPLRKSVLLEMEDEWPEDFERTRGSAFRNRTDISVTGALYHYYAMLTGRAIRNETVRVGYVDTTSYAGLDSLAGLLERRTDDVFCLNDGSFPEVAGPERAERIREFLERYFPIRAPWEKPGT
ncbi:stealth family protein [Planctomonas psychrotolerans]|uniref:stealth family protein n=1 Tax=Planctomonas psychrotolerans TaxID=2528712 RepID=UPI001239662E|nr:stealth family protein [Planctomonas psychrotolerans]